MFNAQFFLTWVIVPVFIFMAYWVCEAIVCRSVHVWSHMWSKNEMRIPVYLQMCAVFVALYGGIPFSIWLGHHVLHLK